MPRITEVEQMFLNTIKSMPDIDDKKDLIESLMVVTSKLMAIVNELEGPEHIPITSAAGYLSIVAQVHLAGCLDMPMASLSARAIMAENFEKLVSKRDA